LVEEAKKVFKRDVDILCLATDDLFAGKICAALDRQHPRDFFDLYIYFNQFTYTKELHQAFIVYLLSSKRPISELICPNLIDLKPTYKTQFEGMTSEAIDCQTLENTRIKIFNLISSALTDEDKEFLISFKRGEPKWELFSIRNAQDFPSIKWKLHNIRTMATTKREKALILLERMLECV
jgi:hypothetical protein